MLWTDKEPLFTLIHQGRSEGKKRGLDIAGMRSIPRLQVRYTLKNTASVYINYTTDTTDGSGNVRHDSSPRLRRGVTTKNKQDDDGALKKSPTHRVMRVIGRYILYTLSVQGRQRCLASAPAIRPCCFGRVFTFSTTPFALADRASVRKYHWRTF
jgi:hypothetical protein